MKKKLTYLLLIIICFGCGKDDILSKDLKFDKIKIYYVPFHITSPVGSTLEGFRNSKGITIVENDVIEEIRAKLLSLEKLKNDYEFSDTSIHLLCDFYEDNKKVLTLLHDTSHFEIEESIYKNNNDLINLLVKGFPR